MEKEIILVASDHGGFKLKSQIVSWLEDNGYSVKDLGPQSEESVDYPAYASKVAKLISEKKFQRGILVCSSGVGMSIAANRFLGVRASLCYNVEIARHTREHNLSNIICLGQNYLTVDQATDILKAWLEVGHGETERYQKRADMLDNLNNQN